MWNVHLTMPTRTSTVVHCHVQLHPRFGLSWGELIAVRDAKYGTYFKRDCM
jgi:hypothetical protein